MGAEVPSLSRTFWVKLSSVKLMNAYLTDFARHNVEEGLERLPLFRLRGPETRGRRYERSHTDE